MDIFKKDNLVFLFRGLIISFISTFFLLIIYSIILTYSNISENTIHPIILVITGISILIGSIIVNRKISKNGMFNGGIIGLMYILLIYFVSSCICKNFSFNFSSLLMVFVSIVCGMIGGIIGINRK